MSNRFSCDLIAQLLEEEGGGVYDFFLGRQTFLKNYYKDIDMKAFIGEKLDRVYNDPNNYFPETDKLTVQGKAQLKNEIRAILKNEQVLLKRLSNKYDVNSVSLFNRLNHWKDTPSSKYTILEENLIRGYDDVKGTISRQMNDSLDTNITLKSGRKATLSANQLFDKPEFKQAFMEMLVDGKIRVTNLDPSLSENIVGYNSTVKKYIASNKSLGDTELAIASMSYSPKKIVKTENGMDLFSNIISGEDRNFTTKEIEGAVKSFVTQHGHLFRTENDANKVGYMLLGQYSSVKLGTAEAEAMIQLNKTPQGKFKMFNRFVNEGYLKKEGALEIAKMYADEPSNIYKRINNAMATDVATAKMFGRKPLMSLENAKQIAETNLSGLEKSKFDEAYKNMKRLLDVTFAPNRRPNTMDSRGYQLADLGGAILKANRITGAGARTMGDATLGGLKYSMFTGKDFIRSALEGIGITITEVQGKAVRNVGTATKKIAPNGLADIIDNVTSKLDFSLWSNKMSEKDRFKYMETMYGAMADLVYNGGVYDGTWTPLTEIASSKAFKQSGIKGFAQNWSSNFSGLQFKETVGNVNSWFFSNKFRRALTENSKNPVIAKYLEEIGFDKKTQELYKSMGSGFGDSDVRNQSWFKAKGERYKDFMEEFFVPRNLDDLREDQISMIVDIAMDTRQGESLVYDAKGTLNFDSKENLLERIHKDFPKVAKDLKAQDFEVLFQPNTKSAHVKITSDAYLKGGLAEDSSVRLAIRESYKHVREAEMRAVKEEVMTEYLENGKIRTSKHGEVRKILNEIVGIKQQSDGTTLHSFTKREDEFVANFYLDKIKDFERAIFYEFASVKPSLKLRLVQDQLRGIDNSLGMIVANSLAFKSASLDSIYKYKNLSSQLVKHMKSGESFSGKNIGNYLTLVTALGMIGWINGLTGEAYNMAVDKSQGKVVDNPDLIRKGISDVVGFPTGVTNPSIFQTSMGRLRQDPLNEIAKQMLTNDVLVNKLTKDLVGEMSSAYGLERKRKANVIDRAKARRRRAKRRGKINPITGRVKKD